MRLAPGIGIFAFAAMLLAPLALASNPPQHGEGGDCIDDLATYFYASSISPMAKRVSVDDLTTYTVTSTSDHLVVDFYRGDGRWVGWTAGAVTGLVPRTAVYGIVCPARDVPDPIFGYAVDPTASWTYTDGF